MGEEEAYEFVMSTLRKTRVTPNLPRELDLIRSAEACINCGTCLGYCPVVAAVGVGRFAGPRSIAVALTRSPPEYWTTADTIYLCTGCGTCREVCPKNVNIPEIVNMVRARIWEHRRDLVPRPLHRLGDTLSEHGLAFEPWESAEEKEESRRMRLERFGLPDIPDRTVDGASILFYPGCQAEERSQEVKEAAKVILDHFGVSWTLLDEMSCCGLPAKLIGDTDTARHLAETLKRKVKSSGAEMIVTTCAGCTSRLDELSRRDDWGVPVYHMLEFLTDVIGLPNVKKALTGAGSPDEATPIGIHDPCHLIRHTTRRIEDHAREILSYMPGVTVVRTGVSDSCCGGGGLVVYHSRSVARAVTDVNVAGIAQTDPERIVTPCPLCMTRLEDALVGAGVRIEVDDMTVFIAQHLKGARSR